MINAETTLHPTLQYDIFATRVRHPSLADLQPEKRLILAVLEHAADDFRTYAFVRSGRGRWLFMEASEWFRSTATGLFDFEGICQTTGLDPDFIRKCLRSWYESAAAADRFEPIGTKHEERWGRGELSESA